MEQSLGCPVIENEKSLRLCLRLWEMEIPSSDEILECMSSCLSQIKWRLKLSSKRRLEIGFHLSFSQILYQIMKLEDAFMCWHSCTGMRPVVMIDYGGKLPELQDRLLSLLELLHEALPIFKALRVMVIEDMIYLINVTRLAKWLSSEPELFFVDLEQDPPQMVEQSKECSLGMELQLIQKLFSVFFIH
ncbi:unnamed protein product [Eruca vesicaria subsp. sativa]|uniref:Uncharacterized protein n=1 Tax=Eruca vesicaria subsp. sativa TaxID=29727 RepID=A0ABC8KPP2_ERUVS|nr:unnamed protein product [Eruca vesicaria subsp. sativa]